MKDLRFERARDVSEAKIGARIDLKEFVIKDEKHNIIGSSVLDGPQLKISLQRDSDSFMLPAAAVQFETDADGGNRLTLRSAVLMQPHSSGREFQLKNRESGDQCKLVFSVEGEFVVGTNERTTFKPILKEFALKIKHGDVTELSFMKHDREDLVVKSGSNPAKLQIEFLDECGNRVISQDSRHRHPISNSNILKSSTIDRWLGCPLSILLTFSDGWPDYTLLSSVQ